MNRSPRLLLAVFLCSGFFITSRATDEPAFDLASLHGRHPRLFAAESDFVNVRQREWDALGERYREFLSDSGEAMLELPLVENKLRGYRLLGQSVRAFKRVATWSLLFRLEGDSRYRDRTIAELENLVAFPSWNPRHFLDVGEMALAVSVGTDWLWDELSEDQRDRFLAALKEKAIEPSLDESHPDNWWLYYYNNWNPVCHSGLTAAALLLADREPDLAEQVIERAMRAFPAALEAYQPDGAYPEGPGYWDYGTNYSCLLLNLIDEAFGSTLGLDNNAAFRASATYRAGVVTPSGRFYNYADGHDGDRFAVATAWFASRYHSAPALYEMHRGLKASLERDDWDPENASGRLLPFLALWYPDFKTLQKAGTTDLPRVWHGRGPNPVAFIRSAWGRSDAFFLGFKGGDGAVSHAHLDFGSFLLEDKGVRWAVDLGSQGYGRIEQLGFGLWDRRQHSDRWRVFRLGPYSHNTLLIDQRMPDVMAKATITQLTEAGSLIEGTVALTPVYRGQADLYERRFKVHDFSVVEILDTIRGARERTERQGRNPATLRWRMVTEAQVTVEGQTATLRQEGKTLHLVVASPDEGLLRAAPLDPPPAFWDQVNPGMTSIDFWCKTDDQGDRQVRTLLSTDEAALEEILSRPPQTSAPPPPP